MYSFPPCMNLHNDFASCYQCFMLLLALCCLPAKLCVSGATRQGGEVPTGSQLRSEGKIMRLIFIFVHVHFFLVLWTSSIQPSIYPSICPSIHVLFYLIHPSIVLSIHLSIHFFHPSIHHSILSTRPLVCLVRPSIHPPLHRSILSVNPSIIPSCPSFHPSKKH